MSTAKTTKLCHQKFSKISGTEEDWRAERPMVQRASTEAPSISGGHRESRMGLGIGYTAYQSGYNKLFTQVINKIFFFLARNLIERKIDKKYFYSMCFFLMCRNVKIFIEQIPKKKWHQ